MFTKYPHEKVTTMSAKVCSRCKNEKSVDEFCKSSRAKDGRQPACKTCMADSWRRSRNKRKTHYNTVQKDRTTRNVQLIQQWKSQRGCHVCGETAWCCLDLHHLDPSVKEANPSDLMYVSVQSFLKEAEKCIVLCSNCHRKVHAGELELSM